MRMIADRQKIAFKNIELLESLRILRIYFPDKYKKRVDEWERKMSKFYNYFCDKKKIYEISLSFSPNCGTFFNNKKFKSEFKAMEYSLINALNGRCTTVANQCKDSKCRICY